MEYKLWLGHLPMNDMESHLLELLHLVEEHIVIGYEKNLFMKDKMKPEDIIIMIITNLIVNLFGAAQNETSNIKSRIMLLESLIEQIKTKSMTLWKTIETASASADINYPH
jgi:hypothetical protein